MLTLGVKSPTSLLVRSGVMEPTEAQYLILNALDTLGLLENTVYDQDNGIWYISTASLLLPFAMLLPNGEITPITPVAEL